MTTQKDGLFLKLPHSDTSNYFHTDNNLQFSNFNLNQSHNKYSGVLPHFQLNSNSKKEATSDFTLTDNFGKRRKSWNKSTKNLCSKTSKYTILRTEADEKERKRWKNDISNNNQNNSSTLSLHISAYENSIEADKNNEIKDFPKKSKGFKSVFSNFQVSFNSFTVHAGKTFLFQKKYDIWRATDTFEFPRQQEGNGQATPEIQKFAASQKLFSPNQEMTPQIVMNFKGKEFVITLDSDVLPLFDKDELSLLERLTAIKPYIYLSPLTTLKSAEYKLYLLKTCEIEAYKNRQKKMEYLSILHHYVSKLFPELEFSTNDKNQICVKNLSQPALYSILGSFIMLLKTFNRFDLLMNDSGYTNIMENAKKENYSNIQEFTNDVHKILLHLKKSSYRLTSEAAEDMLDEYLTHLTPIFQHLGFCCAGIIDYSGTFYCAICKRYFHDFCENYCSLVDGDEFICHFCKFLNDIPESPNMALFKDFKHYNVTERMEKNVKKLFKAKGSTIEDINIRLIYNDKKSFKTHSSLIKHYSYPPKLFYQKKVFVAFQKVEGFETLLFYLEVHEYNDHTIDSNRRYVNIAYIDSVQYFTPEDKELRRSMYYEIIQTYLKFAKEMGYIKAYIWISPPDNMQEYVFNQHKIPYRPPTRPSLKKFYQEMLEQAKERKIIYSFNAMERKEPFNNEAILTLKDVPYLYGDFWYWEFERAWKEFDEKHSKTFYPVQLLKDIKSALKEPVNEGLMLIVELISPNSHSKVLRSPIKDTIPVIKCDIISDREEFLIYQRSNHYSFQTIQHAHLSTKRLGYEIKKDYKVVEK